jgi:hypothetical protein
MAWVSGWWVVSPDLWPDVPTDPADLVVKVGQVRTNFPVDHLCESEDEAWRLARRFLTEEKERAAQDLHFMSNLTQGASYHGSPKKLAAWIAKRKRRLAAAEAGVKLCPPE